MSPEDQLIREGLASIGNTFRGQIWENCARFQLCGVGYNSMPPHLNRYFSIEFMRHCEGPLRALLDPNVRVVFIRGATQVGKSVVGDVWIPFIVEHFPGSMIVYFEDDPKGKTFARERLMPTLENHPIIKTQIKAADTYAATTTTLQLPGMSLQICGLNEGNTSTISYQYIWISEAWQHKSDGQEEKAMKRADRFDKSSKILDESQCGDEGEDAHRLSKTAHQVPLTWACPHCGGRQSWECTHELAILRPDDFPATEKAKPGTYAGMKWDNGADLSIDEKARTATWECYHCGEQIRDTPAIRKAIMDSYQQDYQIVGKNGLRFSPVEVCFTLPKESHPGNTFEKSVRRYLSAKEAQRNGNTTPLADWYKSDRAKSWHPRLVQSPVSVSFVASNESDNPNEAFRVLSVDCQQGEVQFKTGKFWWIARAIDKDGKELRQLGRGYAESWKEIIDVQRGLKIPNANCAFDGGNYLDEILDKAAECGEWVEEIRGRKKFKVFKVWQILCGDKLNRSSFPHPLNDGGKIMRSFSVPSFHRRVINYEGKQMQIGIPVYIWSNLSVKDHLHRLRLGGPNLPKLLVLPRESLPAVTQQKERDGLTYSAQMDSEYRGRERGRDKWLEYNPNVHYRDCECECLVLFDMAGKLGMPATAEQIQEAA